MAQRFRLLTDEHFPNSVTDLLRDAGRDVERVEEGRSFAGMLVWTQQNRYRMRPGHFLRQLEALEAEENPFEYGLRHIQPE